MEGNTQSGLGTPQKELALRGHYITWGCGHIASNHLKGGGCNRKSDEFVWYTKKTAGFSTRNAQMGGRQPGDNEMGPLTLCVGGFVYSIRKVICYNWFWLGKI